MNCYFHTDQPAVATCKDCGKFLCKACCSQYNLCVCDHCFPNYIPKTLIYNKASFFKALFKGIAGGVVWLLLMIFLNNMDLDLFDYLLYLISGIIFSYGFSACTAFRDTFYFQLRKIKFLDRQFNKVTRLNHWINVTNFLLSCFFSFYVGVPSIIYYSYKFVTKYRQE